VLGAPFTAWLMSFSVLGLKGWQTMYVVQGLLTVLVGASVPFLLPNGPADAAFLTADEKTWLQRRLDEEERHKQVNGATTLRQGFLDIRVLMTTLTCFFLVCANFGTVLFLPQILKSVFPALNTVQISLMISAAFAVGGIAGIICGRHSDRTGDRKWHIVISAVVATLGFTYAAIAGTPLLEFAGICIGVLGVWSIFGVFWAHAGDLLGGAAAAGGLAFINSLGSLGGVVAPNVLAYARGATGSFSGSLLALAAFALLTALVASTLSKIATVKP
jgi:MFS transporter, ACS family, tartrate transporter